MIFALAAIALLKKSPNGPTPINNIVSNFLKMQQTGKNSIEPVNSHRGPQQPPSIQLLLFGALIPLALPIVILITVQNSPQ